MKCTLCNERNGNTRCEGCNTLFCLPCMNKHHDELVQQFQLLMDVRNEVKQSLDIAESTSKNTKKVSSFSEIDRWETEVIRRIQQTAAKARMNVHEILARYTTDIRDRFERLSTDMQRRQKEGNYLDNDINRVKDQLDQLKNDIEHVNEKVQINSTISNNIKWDTLIYITEGERSSNTSPELVANNNENTKKKSKSSFSSIVSKSQQNNDPSSMISQREQVAEKQNVTEIPVRVEESSSSSTRSNWIDYEPRTYPDNADHAATNRPRKQILYRPAYDTGFAPDVSLTPKTVDRRIIHCPRCNHTNVLYSEFHSSNYYCSVCQSLIQSPY